MRQGELLGLHWPEVDLDGHRIALVQSLVTPKKSPPVLEGLKTWESRRSVGLVDLAVDALSQLDGDSGLVFRSQKGTFLNPSNIVNRSFKPLIAHTGLPPSPSKTCSIPPPACYRGWVYIPNRFRKCWVIRIFG